MDEYIYHNMSIEEDKLFVKDNKIQLLTILSKYVEYSKI